MSLEEKKWMRNDFLVVNQKWVAASSSPHPEPKLILLSICKQLVLVQCAPVFQIATSQCIPFFTFVEKLLAN
jgi:hypothetical protein